MKNRSVSQIVRTLHRDVGFLLIGLTVIYCLSGLLLIYRDTGFLKSEQRVEKTIETGLALESLSRITHSRLELVSDDGKEIVFKSKTVSGLYEPNTGKISYTAVKLPPVLEKLNALHKTSARSANHWFAVAYAGMLLFMALSSFWMYKPESKIYKRGLTISAAGAVVAVAVLII